MRITRRTVVTFERLERSSYHLRDSEPVVSECQQCQAEVAWITPTQALALTGLTLREIFRRIEANKVHFNETGTGLVQICSHSLEPRLGDQIR